VGLRRVSVIDREGLIIYYENKKKEGKDRTFGGLFLGLVDAAATTCGYRRGFMSHGGFIKDPVDLSERYQRSSSDGSPDRAVDHVPFGGFYLWLVKNEI
jgi:hypothetical protein